MGTGWCAMRAAGMAMSNAGDDLLSDFGRFVLSDHARSGRHAIEYGTLAELASLIWPTQEPTPALCRRLADTMRLAQSFRIDLPHGTSVPLFDTLAPIFPNRALPSTRVGWCIGGLALGCGADRIARPSFGCAGSWDE